MYRHGADVKQYAIAKHASFSVPNPANEYQNLIDRWSIERITTIHFSVTGVFCARVVPFQDSENVMLYQAENFYKNTEIAMWVCLFGGCMTVFTTSAWILAHGARHVAQKS